MTYVDGEVCVVRSLISEGQVEEVVHEVSGISGYFGYFFFFLFRVGG